MDSRGFQPHIDLLSASADVRARFQEKYVAHIGGAGCSAEGAQEKREKFLAVRKPRDEAAVLHVVTYLAVRNSLAETNARHT